MGQNDLLSTPIQFCREQSVQFRGEEIAWKSSENPLAASATVELARSRAVLPHHDFFSEFGPVWREHVRDVHRPVESIIGGIRGQNVGRSSAREH